MLKSGSLRYDTFRVSTGASRKVVASALALALTALGSPSFATGEPHTPVQRLRSEMSSLLGRLTAVASAADDSSERWMELQLQQMSVRAAEEQARLAFQDRVRAAYMAGPGRAVDFLLSSSDLYELAARLPYATTSIALGAVDASDVTALRRSLDSALRETERAQQAMTAAERRFAVLRATIEQRLAAAEAAASAAADARALAAVGVEAKRYAGTLQRVSGSTRSIRRARGEAMYRAAAPFLGPRPNCTIPKGLRSTGDHLEGATSWYGDAFRGKPTASGALFWSDRYTVAHRTLPFGLFLLVRYGKRCVVSFLNDRGPYVDGRILDLSFASAQAIGLSGVKDVSATLLVRTR